MSDNGISEEHSEKLIPGPEGGIIVWILGSICGLPALILLFSGLEAEYFYWFNPLVYRILLITVILFTLAQSTYFITFVKTRMAFFGEVVVLFSLTTTLLWVAVLWNHVFFDYRYFFGLWRFIWKMGALMLGITLSSIGGVYLRRPVNDYESSRPQMRRLTLLTGGLFLLSGIYGMFAGFSLGYMQIIWLQIISLVPNMLAIIRSFLERKEV